MCGVVCRSGVSILFTRRDRHNIFRNLPGIGPFQHLEGHPGYRGFRLHYRCDHSVLQRPSSAHAQTIIGAFSELTDAIRRLHALTGACFSEVVESNLIAVANALPFSAPPKDTLDVEGIEDGVDLCKRSLRSS